MHSQLPRFLVVNFVCVCCVSIVLCLHLCANVRWRIKDLIRQQDCTCPFVFIRHCTSRPIYILGITAYLVCRRLILKLVLDFVLLQRVRIASFACNATAVFVMAVSLRLSVCLSVRYIPVILLSRRMKLVSWEVKIIRKFAGSSWIMTALRHLLWLVRVCHVTSHVTHGVIKFKFQISNDSYNHATWRR